MRGVNNGRLDRIGGRYSRNVYIASLIALLLVTGEAFGAYTANPRLPTTYWINSAGQWQTAQDFEVRKAGVPARYVRGTVALSAASLGKLTTKLMAGPVGFLLITALDNYVWDDATQKWMTPSGDVTYTRPVGGWTTIPTQCTDTMEQAGSRSISGTLWYGYSTFCIDGNDPNKCGGQWPLQGGSLHGINVCGYCQYPISKKTCVYKLTTTDPDTITVPGDPGVEVADETIGQALIDHPDAQTLIPKVVNESIRRALWPNTWSEMDTAVSDIEAAFQAVDDGTADSVQTALESGAQETPQTQQVHVETSVEVNFPVFCSWATVVCDFITWMQSDPGLPINPVLPVEEVGMQTWDSGLGGGSCPAPYSITVQGRTVDFDYDDACWAAEFVIYPVLMLLSFVGAAYIIIGSRS